MIIIYYIKSVKHSIFSAGFFVVVVKLTLLRLALWPIIYLCMTYKTFLLNSLL